MRWPDAVLLVASGLAVAGCGIGDRVEGAPTAASEVATGDDSVSFEVDLLGEAVVPGPGAGAEGRAFVTLEPSRGQVCFTITTEGLDMATGAHLHAGGPGEAGDVVVSLDPPSEGRAEGCATADGTLLERMAARPLDYYVSVRTESFPEGAVRGQLASP